MCVVTVQVPVDVFGEPVQERQAAAPLGVGYP
jgi:hypothetical protein